jgi:Family of unknown function (DUF6504)
MRGIRGEPVEVWLRSDRPARFVWRGRMYTVMIVLDRQVTSAGTPDDPATGGDGFECWRLEATPERSVPPATYELCRDLSSGRWLLSRA